MSEIGLMLWRTKRVAQESREEKEKSWLIYAEQAPEVPTLGIVASIRITAPIASAKDIAERYDTYSSSSP